MNKLKNKGIGIHLFLLVVIIILFMFSSVNAQTHNIRIDKEVFVLGETVEFEIFANNNSVVEVVSPNNVYRLFGDLVGKHTFVASELGTHNIRILDKASLEEIMSQSYEVVEYIESQNEMLGLEDEDKIILDKKYYAVGESILIIFNIDVSGEKEYSLSIYQGDNYYSFIGTPNVETIFIPENEGTYNIELVDIDTNEIFRNSFIVQGEKIVSAKKQGKVPIIIDSKGDEVLAVPKFIDENKNEVGVDSLQNDVKYEVEFKTKSPMVKKIKLNGYSRKLGDSFGLDDVSSKKFVVDNKKSLKTYAIDIPLNFTNGTATSVARGTELYKCQEWNFSTQTCYGTWNKIADIVPGEEYIIQLYPGDPGYAETGVASVNTNESVYISGNVAEIIMVVLDTQGFLVSNADVDLEVSNPDGSSTYFSTDDSSIVEESKGIYIAEFTDTAQLGKYDLFVSATGTNVDSNMTSYFFVQDYYEFGILRDIPVTVDPFKKPFSSTTKLWSYTNDALFNFTEKLPINFTIINSGGAQVYELGDFKYLKWEDVQNGSSVSYIANPPLITPELWEIGPAFIDYLAGTFFEFKPWFLAVDPSYYYDPNSTISSGWTDGTGTTFAEIDDGDRYNNPPDTDDYLESTAGDNAPAEYGFPDVPQTEADYVTLWVYTGTGNNAQYTFELRQGATQRCSTPMSTGSTTQWYSCNWTSPTADLSDLRVYLGGVSKSGGGKNQPAYVYAAYLEVVIGNLRPSVSLNYPGIDAEVNDALVDFNFTPIDAEDSTLDNCSLWGNFSGSWDLEATDYSPTNGSVNNITISPNDGVYNWNIQCFDTGGKGAFATSNRTVTVNSNPPIISDWAFNTTLINQSETVRFNVSITDAFGVSTALATLRYPDGNSINYSLSNTGDEYYYVFTDTSQLGFYNLTLIWANDTKNLVGDEVTSNLYFEVVASPPAPFDLLTPANYTISNNLLPTLYWQQTVEPDFDNYTLLFDKDSTFSTPDFTYNTYLVGADNYTVDFALDGNSVYYWRVIAYDDFGSYTISTNDYMYITDNTAPSINLEYPPNNDYLLSPNAEFNFTPSETYNLDTCILYGDFSGSFESNETLNPVSNNVVNSIYTTLNDEGVFVWNVWCNDSATNVGFAVSNRTIIVDFTGPSIEVKSPANNTYENETNLLVFVANATDALADVDSCDLVLNGVIDDSKSVTEGEDFNFTRFVSNGDYNWTINCTDTNGWQSSSWTYNLTVEVIDADAPLITLNYPTPYQFLLTTNIDFNFTPEDATGIENCSLFFDDSLYSTNDSIVNFVPNYFSVTGISEGEHNWTVGCYDNSTEYNYYEAPLRYFTIDLDVPTITLHEPHNATFQPSTVTFNYTPTDDYLDSCALYGNFSGGWAEDQVNGSVISGQYNYFEKTLSDGSYLWNVWCNHSAGTYNFSTYNYTFFVDTTPPQYSSINVLPASPASYALGQNYDFNITWTDNFNVDVVLLENNFSGTLTNITVNTLGSGIYNYTVFNLDVGSYHYKWFANDSQNNLNQTNSFTYMVGKTNSVVEVLLNESNTNFTDSENVDVNITGRIVTPSSGNIEVYLDGVLINSGSSPLENITNFVDPGNYNVTVKYGGSPNYNPSSDTKFILIEDTVDPTVLLSSPGDGNNVSSGSIVLEYNVSDSSEIVNCSLYINGTYEDTNYSIERDTPQIFTINRPSGSYAWYVTCFDLYNNSDTSPEWTFNAIDTDAINVDVTTKNSYERGENATIQTSTEDVFNQPLETSVISDVILGNTTSTWWNTAWAKRKPIYMNETGGVNRTGEFAEVNITGLSNNITTCVNEIRIIHQTPSVIEEVPIRILSGDDDNYCFVTFNVDIEADATNANNYYVYYNNSAAGNPGYNLDTTVNYEFYAAEAATDEGTPTTVTNIIGNNDGTSAQMLVSGGGAAAEAAHGRAFIPQQYSETVEKVEVRYRYEVPTSTTNWYLRYSVNDGGLYSNYLTGTTTVAKTTSNWFDVSNDYSALTWSEINRTRLQGRVSKPGGGGGATLNLFWVQMNVTARIEANITETAVGQTHEFIERGAGSTSVLGDYSWVWDTHDYEYGNYSAVSLAYKTGYTNNTAHSFFELLPDTTPPNVTLNYPEDLVGYGAGEFSFNYTPYDINLDNCTLYSEITGIFEKNESHLSPWNNNTNAFTPIYLSIGLHEWNVLCFDTEGNNAFATLNFTLNITGPDLTVTSNDIYFGSQELLEDNNLTVYANISNIGLSDANESFYVQFFLGDPDLGGAQINGDVFVQNLSKDDNITVSVNHTLVAGLNNIFVVVDPYDTVNESNENNNKSNRSVSVVAYQYFYGTVSSTLVLGDSASNAFLDFNNYSNGTGNIYFADEDSSFSFTDLVPLTRNSLGNPAPSDFTELDSLLGTTNFEDSIKTVWGGGTDSPLRTDSFEVSGSTLTNVPVVNSTNSTSFITGILWDEDDDGTNNLQFDSGDQEDIVFVTKINKSTAGLYGNYDYEIKIPANLRDYKAGTNKVVFYTEII